MDLSVLNNEQRQAVEHTEGPLLVLAGAGSGKTRVLTYRIANLIENGVSPWNILALTFTNKAAGEMKERTERLVGSVACDMWVMTFHSCCARILRFDIEALGRSNRFVIYDDADQLSVIGDVLKSMDVDEKKLSRRAVLSKISEAKNRADDPEEYLAELGTKDEVFLRAYRKYQKRLLDADALDFDDLLLTVNELFDKCPDVLDKYRRRFRYVMVDEYQDTNLPQYKMVQLICSEHKNLCVVGDDDQSIYGWRGADTRNILEFETDFPGCAVVRLEQNYRSTAPILDAANELISHNIERKEKRLWTSRKGGERVNCRVVSTERDEADFVCRTILDIRRGGVRYDDCAVLYRTNAQSRVFEAVLTAYRIPYKVYGGQRFYDRREIKDIMTYLRLFYNPKDDAALRRIINVPRRSIGDRAVAELASLAAGRGCSMLEACAYAGSLGGAMAKNLTAFGKLINELNAERAQQSLADFTRYLVERVDYVSSLTDDRPGERESRVQNIDELIGNIAEVEGSLEVGVDPLSSFLENVALVSDIDGMREGDGAVALMSLHSAKGLEFPVVFMVGMEEDLFPISRARSDPSDMEEERRLCYVGMTRAKDKLYMTHTRQRMLYGKFTSNIPSRFLQEIPAGMLTGERVSDIPRRNVPGDYPSMRVQSTHGAFGGRQNRVPPVPVEVKEKAFSLHQPVRHANFGDGTVCEISGSGKSMMVAIDFPDIGIKRFAAAYAPIEPRDNT